MSDHLPDHRPAGELRASDADREAVVERLRVACGEGRLTLEEMHERVDAAYEARTQGELVPLTRDLPTSADGAGPAPAYLSADVPAAGPPVVAVFGGSERKGRWRPARRETAIAVFGGVALDLRDAELPSGTLEVRAYAVFGGVDISVPEGVPVEMTGLSLFGGRDVDARQSQPSPGMPVLRVHAVAVFGGVTAKTRQRRPRPGQ